MDRPLVEHWAEVWHRWVTAAYLGAYLHKLAGSGLLPEDHRPLTTLLDFYLVDKCVYELGYELNNRPEWVWVPLLGLRQLLEGDGAGSRGPKGE